MDDPHLLRIVPPLLVAVATTTCWKCGSDMKAAALIVSHIEGIDGEALMLEHVDRLPDSVLRFVQQRVPDYRRGFSRTMGNAYLANHCSKCGAILGDFYAYSEPGGPFWPETVDDAKKIHVEECPLSNPLEVDSGYGIGLGDFILEHASWEPSESGNQ